MSFVKTNVPWYSSLKDFFSLTFPSWQWKAAVRVCKSRSRRHHRRILSDFGYFWVTSGTECQLTTLEILLFHPHFEVYFMWLLHLYFCTLGSNPENILFHLLFLKNWNLNLQKLGALGFDCNWWILELRVRVRFNGWGFPDFQKCAACHFLELI